MARGPFLSAAVALGFLIQGSVPPDLRAQSVPAITFTSATTGSSGAWSLGFRFNVLSQVYVTDLGFFDYGQDGLTEAHEIGVWDPFGVLLGSASIAAGGGTLDGWFRYVSVDPFALAIGEGYRIGATTGSEYYAYGATAITTDPAIVYTGGAYAASSSLVYPQYDARAYAAGYFGPNMMFAYELPETGSQPQDDPGESLYNLEDPGLTVNPEPATMALLATGLVSLMGAGWLRRRRAAA